ncbi:hypothetical protein Tco_0491050 [Tanacetum coccineum]
MGSESLPERTSGGIGRNTQGPPPNPNFTGLCSPKNPKDLEITSPKDLFSVQRFTSTNWRYPWDPYSIYQSIRMTGTLLGGDSKDDDRTTTPTTKEQIEGCLSALRSLVKEHNSQGNISSIRLHFNEDGDGMRIHTILGRR